MQFRSGPATVTGDVPDKLSFSIGKRAAIAIRTNREKVSAATEDPEARIPPCGSPRDFISLG